MFDTSVKGHKKARFLVVLEDRKRAATNFSRVV